MSPICEDITIYQGADWAPVLQWLSETLVHKPITAITVGLPTLITATAHGITGSERVPVWITGVVGPRSLNTGGYTASAPRWAKMVDVDTLTIDFDSALLSPYKRGGVLTYHPPIDLTGWSAREEIRTSIAAPDALVVLDSTAGGITLGADGFIRRVLTAAATTALPRSARVHMLELTDPNGVVQRFSEGAVCVSPDFPEDAAP